MQHLKIALASVLAASLLLTGCGGGAEVDVVVTPDRGPDFDLIALIDGDRLSGVDVFPGEEQTISVVAGDAFELDSSGSVFWDLSAGGSAAVPASAGSTFIYRGASLTETSVGDGHLVLAVDSNAPAGSVVPITVIVTSQFDSGQVATVNLLVSN